MCYKFNRSSGQPARSCPFPHQCRHCRSANHSTLTCLASISKDSSRPYQSSSSRDRANDKVQLLARNILPSVSTPINVAILERELSHHPNRDFSNSLINALRVGTHVGYTGPEKNRVSRNLISAVQHSKVVSSNLTKEISLGRVAGPFPSPPLSHMQCHPLCVVPKKHSSDWRTIYHLSYPEGDGINDYIPKGPYALQYVRVDDAIRILLPLGPGSYEAKTDLKSAFSKFPNRTLSWASGLKRSPVYAK